MKHGTQVTSLALVVCLASSAAAQGPKGPWGPHNGKPVPIST
jgi:hypothetical protein